MFNSQLFNSNNLQANDWMLFSPKASVTRTNIFGENWSLGYGLSWSFNKSVNLNKKISRNNFSTVLKLTKKINDQLFINIGSIYKTSSLNEITEYAYYDISPQTINEEATNFYLQINFF